jgi:hypothetical protein
MDEHNALHIAFFLLLLLFARFKTMVVKVKLIQQRKKEKIGERGKWYV